MKKLLIVVAAGILAATAVACGSDNTNKTAAPTATPQIQSQSGLAVAAAVQAGQRAQDQLTSSDKSSTGSGSLAPSAETSNGSNASVYNASYSISNDGLTVTGYGMASTAADSAVLELYFSTSGVYPTTGSGSSDGTTPKTSTSAISEEDLQPVIDALVSAGVTR